MTSHRTIHRLLLAALVATWAPAATAQDQPIGAIPVSLADGVRQSLDQARLVRLAREDVNIQEAAVRQARGAFDPIVDVNPLFEHREDNIENTAFFNQERVKRGFAQGLSLGFGQAADLLEQQIRLGRGDLPLCPAEGSFSSYFVTLPGTTLPVPLCRPASLSFGVQTLDPTNKSFLLRQPLPFEPLTNDQLQAELATAFRVQISTASLDARERSNELLQTLATAARIVQVTAGLSFVRLGALPEFVYSDTASLFASYTKPLRNGTVFQFSASFDGRATLFRDKPIDPVFGGTDVPNNFGNRLELAWLQPLARGRGAASAQAALRAAEKNAQASRFSFEQISADQALSTAEAYIALMVAQESLALTRESLNTQRRTLDSTIRLVGAGEIAAVDLARSRARTSEVEADVETQRLAVVSAQATLADAMGISSDRVTTLVASDVFPARPLELDLDGLARDALNRRSDVKAAAALTDTGRILLAAAKADARPRFDVRLSGGYAQSYAGPIFHSLGDENGLHLTNDDYLTYYNPGGFGRAFKAPWEPIAAVTGTFELPLGNNQRLGRVTQAVASARESEIQQVDLSRTIQNNLPKLAEEVRRARTVWEQSQEAVIQYEATWDVAQRLRAAGDLTLIDTLLTEQQLTQARLQLVIAKGDYASALIRFRRETGTIVDVSDWRRPQANVVGVVTGR